MAKEDTFVNVETNMDLPSNKMQKAREMMTDVPVEGIKPKPDTLTSEVKKYNFERKKLKDSRSDAKYFKQKQDAKVKEVKTKISRFTQPLNVQRKKQVQAPTSNNAPSNRFYAQFEAQPQTDERRLGRFAMHRGLSETYQLPPFLRRDNASGEPLARIRVRKPPMFGGN